ncbi:hypothetical protein VQ049_13345, partial [Staphylococcus arlettae]|uniref:hypothetical protein n=1 Tax=Staphylococcus arlettae TaxID=29378 RepID=UPI003CEFC936
EAYILLREEKERLRRAFIKASYSCKKEHAFSLFIEHHQTGLIDIANMVYNYMQPDNSVTVYNYCIECIDGLLTMLQLQFKKYFVRNIA